MTDIRAVRAAADASVGASPAASDSTRPRRDPVAVAGPTAVAVPGRAVATVVR